MLSPRVAPIRNRRAGSVPRIRFRDQRGDVAVFVLVAACFIVDTNGVDNDEELLAFNT